MMSRKNIKMKFQYIIIGLLLVSVVGVSLSGVAYGQSDSPDIVESTTEYPASTDSQAIGVTLTVSPQDEEISNVSLDIWNTEQAFTDFESFSVTIEPSGAAEIDESIRMVQQDQVKTFSIESLRPDETVRIQFDVYPRKLETDGQTIAAANVQYQYLRNGVEVPGNQPGRFSVNADISGSPVYDLQSTQTRLDGMWAITGIGVLAGIIGLGLGGYIILQNRSGDTQTVSSGDIRSARRRLENVRAKIDARGGADDIVNEIDDILDRLKER